MKSWISQVTKGVLATVFAVALQRLLWTWVSPDRFIFFYPAVVFSSLIGGMISGIVTTVLGVLVTNASFFPEAPRDWMPVGIFFLGGIAISIVNELFQRRTQELTRAQLQSKSDKRFRQIFESSPNALLALVDKDGMIEFVNSYVNKVFGYEPDELVGKSIEVLVPERFRLGHPDLRTRYMECPTPRYMGMGRDLFGRKKDGAEIPIEVALTPITMDDGISILTTVIDLSERIKRASELHELNDDLAFALEVGEVGTFSLDLESRKSERSLRHAQIFGYSSNSSEWSYEKFLNHVLPEDREKVERVSQDSMKEGTDIYFECRIRTCEGEIRWIEVQARPRVQKNKILRYIGLTKDISGRKQQEEEMVKAKESAETAALMKSRFLDVAAHELRTPVTTFSLWLQMAQIQLEKNRSIEKSTFSRLQKQANRLSRLVIDLLDVSRLERGGVALRPETVDLASLVNECLENCKLQAPDRPFLFSQSDPPIEISMDRDRIFQVLSNLLDNAMKYAPGTTPIEVLVEYKSDILRVSVKDHGPGITEQQQTELFNPFGRGKGTQEEKVGGMGLGLYICRGIIELHGGKIGVISKVGEGSTFFFELRRDALSSMAA